MHKPLNHFFNFLENKAFGRIQKFRRTNDLAHLPRLRPNSYWIWLISNCASISAEAEKGLEQTLPCHSTRVHEQTYVMQSRRALETHRGVFTFCKLAFFCTCNLSVSLSLSLSLFLSLPLYFVACKAWE